MERNENIVMTIMAITFAAICIGCIGAFFYDWTWHNLAIGIGAAEMAIVFADTVIQDYRENENKERIKTDK